MSYSANRFENMLKEYLIEQQDDAYNKRNVNFQRYNNLKVYMSPSKVPHPHVWIRVGISEACFSLTDNSVLYGSIGQDSKYIAKWLNKPGIKEELARTWIDANKADFSTNDE